MEEDTVVEYTGERGELEQLIQSGKLQRCKLELPTGYLSASQVGMFLRCQMQFYWRYVVGVIKPPGIAQLEGQTIHKTLQSVLNEKKDTGRSTPLDAMKDVWRGRWVEKEGTVEDWGEAGKEKVYNEIERRSLTFLNLYHVNKLPKIQPKGVEKKIWTEVGYHRIPVVGYIDLIDTINPVKDEIVDHKVVAISKSQAEVEGDLQLSLYAKATGIPSVRFDCFVKTRVPQLKTVESVRFEKDIKWMEHVFDRVAESINLGNFMPCSPTSWTCSPKACGYYSMCRK